MNAIKAMGGGRIGGYAVRFGNPQETDLSPYRDFFTKATDFWGSQWQTRPMLYHHAQDEATKDEPVVGVWDRMTIDNIGVWVEGQINMAHRYAKAIEDLVRRGLLKLSSDSAPHLVVREPQANGANWVKRWPILGVSLTTSPAEPRLRPVEFYTKSYRAIGATLPPAVTRIEVKSVVQLYTLLDRAHHLACHHPAADAYLEAERILEACEESPYARNLRGHGSRKYLATVRALEKRHAIKSATKSSDFSAEFAKAQAYAKTPQALRVDWEGVRAFTGTGVVKSTVALISRGGRLHTWYPKEEPIIARRSTNYGMVELRTASGDTFTVWESEL